MIKCTKIERHVYSIKFLSNIDYIMLVQYSFPASY